MLLCCLGEWDVLAAVERTALLKKFTIEVPYDPAILLLDTQPPRTEAESQRAAGPPMWAMNGATKCGLWTQETMLSLNKEGNSDTCYDTDGPWGLCPWWHKPITKGQILYDAAYMRFPELSDSWRQKVEGSVTGAGAQGSTDGWWGLLYNNMNDLNATALSS